MGDYDAWRAGVQLTIVCFLGRLAFPGDPPLLPATSVAYCRGRKSRHAPTAREVGLPYVLIHHNVVDYDKSRSVFDYDAARRKRLGCRGGRLLRSTMAPNDLFALFEWDTLENAQRFISEHETREAFEWVHSVEDVRAFGFEDVESVEF